MKTFSLLLLSCVPGFAGETLVSLKSGETNGVSYGLSYLVSDSWSATHPLSSEDSSDLFLTVRNDGAKSMGFGDVTVDDFSLQDATGNGMKVYLRTSPQDLQGLANGEVSVIHLMVQYTGEGPQPWTFHFKTKSGEHDHPPLELTITGIKLRKH